MDSIKLIYLTIEMPLDWAINSLKSSDLVLFLIDTLVNSLVDEDNLEVSQHSSFVTWELCFLLSRTQMHTLSCHLLLYFICFNCDWGCS